MKQTEIGMIPDDWEVKEFKNICKKITDGSHFSPAERDIGYYMPSVKDMRQKDFDYSDCKKISYEDYRLLVNQGCKPEKGDVLIAKDGSILKYAFTVNHAEPIVLLSSIAILRPLKNLVFSDYLAHFVTSEKFKEYAINNFKTGTGVPRIVLKGFSKLKLNLPPTLAEQQKIAKTLSDVDNVISTLEKLITKKKNLKQGTMQQLLTGKKRLPGFAKSNKFKQTEIDEIPEDWEVKELGEVGFFTKGNAISKEEANSGYIPAIRYGELYTHHNNYIKTFYSHISEEIAKKAKKLNKGDLLFTCSGETKEDIGKCVAFIGNEEAYAGGDLLILSPNKNINSLYFGFMLNSDFCVKQKASLGQGDAVVHISSESIKKIKISTPSKPEQTAIANVLSSMDKEIEALNTKLEKYRNLKTGMMQQLLTGKIRLV